MLVRVTTKVEVHEGTIEAAAEAVGAVVVDAIERALVDEGQFPEVKVKQQEVYE